MQSLRAILDMAGNVISNLGTPVAGTDAATKDYADTKVADTGDTMSGPLTILQAANPSLKISRDSYPELSLFKSNAPADLKEWRINVAGNATDTDAKASSLVISATNDAGTSIGSVRVRRDGRINLGLDPTDATDAVTKQYADAKVAQSGDTMTGPLIIDRAATSGDTLRIEQDVYPTVRLFKATGAVDAKQWNFYISGPAGETGANAACLTFLAEADNFADQTAIRMYRDGRLLLGADPTAPMEAVTQQYLANGWQASISGASGWFDYGGAYAGAWATQSGPVVILEGLLKRSANLAVTEGGSFQIGTLPSPAWYPKHDILLPSVRQYASSADMGPCRLNIKANGTIEACCFEAGTFTSTGWITLSGHYRNA